MLKAITFMLVGAALSAFQAASQSAPLHPKPKVGMQTARLHQFASEVTVQVTATSSQGTSIGSGVWIGEEYVATCWHVVKDSQGTILVRIAVPTWYDPIHHNLMWGSLYDYEGSLVAKDADSDVGILRVKDSPFKKKSPVMLKTPDQEIMAHFAVAQLSVALPEPGTPTVLAGFPLGRPELQSQSGNVSGIGVLAKVDEGEEMRAALERHASSEEIRHIHERTEKQLRVFVSVVSNPANSGGPVLDEAGNLLGLLQGNLLSPSKDESDRPAVYIRPKRDVAGNPVVDAHGQAQLESAVMLQNSGLSIVIPAAFISDLLSDLQTKANHPSH